MFQDCWLRGRAQGGNLSNNFSKTMIYGCRNQNMENLPHTLWYGTWKRIHQFHFRCRVKLDIPLFSRDSLALVFLLPSVVCCYWGLGARKSRFGLVLRKWLKCSNSEKCIFVKCTWLSHFLSFASLIMSIFNNRKYGNSKDICKAEKTCVIVS